MPIKTFTAGEILTAADVNTYLMRQAVITCTSGTRPTSPSAGMVIFETDTTRLMAYNGSAWAELGMLDPPRCQMMRETTQSLASGAQVAIQWDTEVQNTHGMWSAGNPSRITIPANGGGTYLIGGAASFDANGSGNRQLMVVISGTTHIRQSIPSIGSGLPTRVNISYMARLNPGQYVEIHARQDSGSTLNLTTDENHPAVWVCRIAP